MPPAPSIFTKEQAINNLIPDSSSPIYDDAGSIAIQCLKLGRRLISCSRPYVFVTQANVCMAWVKSEDIDCILRILGGCCGSQTRIFKVANASSVRRWELGGGR